MKKKSVDTNRDFVIIIGIIVCLVIAAFCITFIFMTNKEKVDIYNKEMESIREQNSSAIIGYEEVIEYKTKWTYEELLENLIDENRLSDNTKIRVIVNDEELNNSSVVEFNTVGNYRVVIYLNKEYSYKILNETIKNIEVKRELVLNVKDTIYPVIEGVSDKTITVGDKIDLLSGISARDEIEGEIKVQVEGEVDSSKAGTYTIKIYAVDANGNRVDKEFTVTVKEKTTTNNNSSNNSNNSGNKNNNSSNNNTSSNNSSNNNNSNSNKCSYTSLLQKRGYNSADKEACEKDKQASAVANQIASSIKAKGYTTDLEKVSAAASAVSNYYYQGVHKESGYDYRTPYGVFVKGESSCAGATRALIQVLEAMGYTNLTHANANSWSHQWVILTIDGQIGYADGQVGWVGIGSHPSAG